MKPVYKYSLLTIALAALLGFSYYKGYKSSLFEEHSTDTATILLERILNVHKMVMIEGHFSEIYDHQDYWLADIAPFRKKALIRVQAKVHVGFDMEGLEYTMNEADRTMTIKNIPDAEIISIEHDMDYYDISEGSFNLFGKKELNELNKKAKDVVVDKAMHSDLLLRANERRDELLKNLSDMANSLGWTVILPPDELLR